MTDAQIVDNCWNMSADLTLELGWHHPTYSYLLACFVLILYELDLHDGAKS
jgi:hypothetical protein